MSRCIGIISIMLALIACSDNDKIPHDVMQPEKMQKVLWDTFYAEAAAQQMSGKDSTIILSDKVKELTGEAFRYNKITEAEFLHSYNWYLNHPEVFDVMLDTLYNRKSRTPQDEPALLPHAPAKTLKLEKAKKDSVKTNPLLKIPHKS